MNITLYADALARFLVLFIATTIAFADDDSKEPTYPVKVLSIQTILVDVDGESVVGAKVFTWPNKVNLTGGSTLLTSTWRAIDYIERLLRGDSDWSPWSEESLISRHYQVSDEEGMVTLRDIPVGSEERINVEHPEYDLPYEIGEVRNDVKFRVNAGETEERLLILQKREMKKLKEEK